MTTDFDAEREVDLVRWRRAVVAWWWLPVAGLVVGAIVGALYSLSGASVYKASALISLGQPVSPGGVIISSYSTNPRAIAQITSSASAQNRAAREAHMHPSALRGHVSLATVGTVPSSAGARATPLISLTVQGSAPLKTENAANALANIVVQKTTAPYIGVKIRTFRTTLASVDRQLVSINTRLRALTRALAILHLRPLDELVLVSEEDNAEARQGNLIAQQEALQQQLAFATNVESAKVVEPAAAVKSTARSRRNSILVGALIGLILGAIAAIVVDTRAPRARTA